MSSDIDSGLGYPCARVCAQEQRAVKNKLEALAESAMVVDHATAPLR
jgi:hypothetical protein